MFLLRDGPRVCLFSLSDHHEVVKRYALSGFIVHVMPNVEIVILFLAPLWKKPHKMFNINKSLNLWSMLRKGKLTNSMLKVGC